MNKIRIKSSNWTFLLITLSPQVNMDISFWFHQKLTIYPNMRTLVLLRTPLELQENWPCPLSPYILIYLAYIRFRWPYSVYTVKGTELRPLFSLLVHDSDVALQIQKEHALAVRSQAGDHPEPALGLVDPDILGNVLFLSKNKVTYVIVTKVKDMFVWPKTCICLRLVLC